MVLQYLDMETPQASSGKELTIGGNGLETLRTIDFRKNPMKTAYTKKDLVVVLICVLFLLMNLGAIGESGRRRSKETVCLSNLNQWGHIFSMYTNDNNGYFPRRTAASGRWIDVLANYYIDNEKVCVCPEAKKIANPDMIFGADWWGSTFVSWGKVPSWDSSGGRTAGVYGSYGINGYVYVPGSDPMYKPAGRFWETPAVAGASSIPLLLDCYFWCGWPNDNDTPPYYDGWQNRSDSNAVNRYCLNRHDGGINAVFLDFSVRKVGLKELWTLKWHQSFNTEGPWTIAGGVWQSDWPAWMENFKEY
jgi:prepilin-type processing-associated H-X9-DG protein